MQYLVTMEFVEPGPLFSAQQLGQMVEETILPSFDLLVSLKTEGKVVAGGVLAGTRTATLSSKPPPTMSWISWSKASRSGR